MNSFPVTFTHDGKVYTGDLSHVQGAGSSAVYHLMINNYYRGRLRISLFDNRWVFDGEFTDLAEAFGAWLSLITWTKDEIETNRAQYLTHMIDGPTFS